MPEGEATATRPHTPATPIALAIASVLAVALAAMAGHGGGLGTLASAVFVLLASSPMPAIYLLGAFGLGDRVQRIWLPGVDRPWALRAGIGLAAMLTITHLMGVAGLLTSRAVALTPVVLGVALLLGPMLRAGRMVIAWRASWVWLGATPALGVLLAAACSPPGWLWASEFGGYDVLSYHLQLPRQWLEMGRLWPVEHNVYSYLPGYMEAAFLHVGVMMGASPDGFVARDGSTLAAAQLLHAAITLIGAWLTASAAGAMLERVAAPDPARLAPVAGALVLATPWSVVTGSMAYNEMAVVALFAAALVTAATGELSPARRGLVVGLLIGAACGCKPTAVLFCAPGAGLAMVWGRPRNQWIALTLGACIGGLTMLAPWLVRNALAGGNPVFPQLSWLFGSAHWSAEQVARYQAGHSFEGGLTDALRLLVLPDAGGHYRGLLHAQWAFFAPIVAVCAAGACAFRRSRGVGVLLGATLVLQILAWLTLTHAQSRFLTPMLVPGALAVALGLSRIPLARPARTLGFLCVLAQSAATAGIFLAQKGGYGGPNLATLLGPGLYADAPPTAPDEELGAIAFLNDRLGEGGRVLVVGEARVLYIRRPFAYATTWDTSLLTEVMRTHPDELSEWAAALEEMGFTHVFVDLSELDRLALAGWAEPMLDAGYVLGWLAGHARPIYRDEQGQRLIYELP